MTTTMATAQRDATINNDAINDDKEEGKMTEGQRDGDSQTGWSSGNMVAVVAARQQQQQTGMGCPRIDS